MVPGLWSRGVRSRRSSRIRPATEKQRDRERGVGADATETKGEADCRLSFEPIQGVFAKSRSATLISGRRE